MTLSDQIASVNQFTSNLMLTARFCEYHKGMGDIDPVARRVSLAAPTLKGRSPRASIHRHRFDRDAVVAEPPTDRRVVHSPVRMPHPSFLERSSETGICVEARAHRGRRELGKGWTLSCGGPGRRGVPNRDEPPA